VRPAIGTGDAPRDIPQTAVSAAFEAAYAQLQRIARRQLRRMRPGQTFTTHSLVHETFVKLQRDPQVGEDRNHFFSLAARVMRQVLVDQARRQGARKRGGDARVVTLDEQAVTAEAVAEEVLAIDRVLDRLHAADARLARVVELRFYGGLTDDEAAEELGVTARTVRRDWQAARAFLYRELRHELHRP
jgi:RNA polymerase sigma factor (TIGR02999 family)